MFSLKSNKPGFALATILVLLGVALFGVGAIVTISVLESKIARSQQEGLTAYYVAEAGIQDALWKFNNDNTYIIGLGAGTFSPQVSYTVSNVPNSGQSFTVTILSTSPGYATVTSSGSSDNGNFIAKRLVQTTVFQGTVASPTGTIALMTGGTLSMSNGTTSYHVIGGDLYSSGKITLNFGNSSVLDVGTNNIITSSTYNTNNKGTVTAGAIVTNAPLQTPPGLDFNYYGTAGNYSVKYDLSNNAQLAQFKADITSNSGITSLITYVDGNINFNSWASNNTLKVKGMIVFNGNVTFNCSSCNLQISDPGNHKAGIFVNGNLSDNNGQIDVQGLVYASGSASFNNSQVINIVGGLIAGGTMSFNTGANVTLTYDPVRVAAGFGTGSVYTTGINHWEEEY